MVLVRDLVCANCYQMSSEAIRRWSEVIRMHPEDIRDMSECIRRHQLQRVNFVLRFCAIIGYIQN